MHTTDSAYDHFAEILMDEGRLRTYHSFEEICKDIGADPSALDEIIFTEMGYKGDEILKAMQNLLDL